MQVSSSVALTLPPSGICKSLNGLAGAGLHKDQTADQHSLSFYCSMVNLQPRTPQKSSKHAQIRGGLVQYRSGCRRNPISAPLHTVGESTKEHYANLRRHLRTEESALM